MAGGWLSKLLRHPAAQQPRRPAEDAGVLAPDADLTAADTHPATPPIATRSVAAPSPAAVPQAGAAEPEGPVWPPLIARAASGPTEGAGLDRVFCDDMLLVLTGWVAGAGSISLADAAGPVAPDISLVLPRPDVAAAYGFAQVPDGVLLAFRSPPEGARIIVQAGRQKQSAEARGFPGHREAGLARILKDYRSAGGGLLDLVGDAPAHIAAIAGSAAPASGPLAPQGHMETARSVPGAGGVCVGWTLGPGPFYLVDDAGNCQPLDAALRWNRTDIFDAFSGDYGADCADAGFLQGLPGTFASQVRLVARHGDQLVLLHERAIEPAPRDAVSYARWAFSLPSAFEVNVARFAPHFGPTLRTLIGRAARPPLPEVRQVGATVAEPEVSLVIPLYGRYDFVEHQLLEFAADPFIRERCEIIYVIDDPRISREVFAALDTWRQLYEVPLTVVWGKRNRGFSGASNLGLSLARGRHVLFMNSDVIPTGPGWLDALSRRLDAHADFGLIGTRLLFPSGGVQHDGMVFRYVDSFGVWMNDHPGKGLLPDTAPAGEVVEWPAVTGACLLGRRADLLAVGGFCEDYLIGDFEDSDLCLKMRELGRKVGVCSDIELIHLERQSYGFQGAGDFRLRVTLFNAWLHQERWGADIARLQGAGGEEPA